VKAYRVVLERDASGAWIATVPDLPGCHTYGRSLVEAKRRIREAVALWIDDAAEAAVLEHDVRLPRRALAAVDESRDARARLEKERERAGAATERAVRTLVGDLSLGMRDAADLLGLSHQRVQQLVRRGS